MKAAGIILIVVGILMLIFTNINFTTEKKVADIGPLEINKKENNTIAWPNWVGGIAIAAGAVLLITNKRKS